MGCLDTFLCSIFAACCENTFFEHILSCLKSDTYLEGFFANFFFGEMNAVFRPQNTNTPPISPQTIKGETTPKLRNHPHMGIIIIYLNQYLKMFKLNQNFSIFNEFLIILI